MRDGAKLVDRVTTDGRCVETLPAYGLLRLTYRRGDPLVRERQLAHAQPQRVRDSVGDCRSGGPLGRFPGADAGELRPVYQLDLDGGDLAEFQDRVLLPAKTCDAAFAELHLLLQRPAGRLNRATLDLVDHAVRVDDEPDVDGEKQPLHAYFMIDLHLGDHRAVCAEVLVFCESDAVTAALTGGPVPPARAPRHRLDYRAGTRVPQVAQAVLDGVKPRGFCKLVHEGLD